MKTTCRNLLCAFAVTTVLSAVTQAQSPPSGMLLGIYAFENWQGLRVQGTIPGYSAEGRLFPGDVLLRATTDGVSMYPIGRRFELEWAKDRIGPYTPAAIEYFRPGVGLMYAWVEFQPVGGGVQAYDYAGRPVQQAPAMRAQFKTESERPGARALFNRGPGNGPNAGNFPLTNPVPGTTTVPRTGGLVNPGSLFPR